MGFVNSLNEDFRKKERQKQAEFYERACKFAGYGVRVLKIKNGEIREVG